MNQPDLFSRMGVTPVKLAMVAVLFLVFVIVVVAQFFGSKKVATGPQATTASRVADEDKSKESPPKTRVSAKRRSNNPKKTSASSKKTRFRNAKANVNPASTAKPGSEAKTTETIHWPSISLNEMDQRNPFELPKEIDRIRKAKEEEERKKRQAAKEAAARFAEQQRKLKIRQVVQKMQQEGVRMVYISGKERVAQIGDRVVRVHDEFDGVRVTEIKENGTVIVDALPPAVAPGKSGE